MPDPRDPITGQEFPPGPIRLADHQKRIIDEALSRDENGNLKYSTVIYSAPKKSGKSALTSGIMLYTAYHNPNSYIACIANDGKQSTDRLYAPIYTTFRLHRHLGGVFKDVNPNRNEVILDNFTKIEPIPCDAAGEAGSQPLLTCWSELWGFETETKRRVWCYDTDTEILTRSGWKRYDKLLLEDEIATLNSSTNNLEWQKPTAINIFDYTGDMYTCNSRDIQISVTEGHRFYGRMTTELDDKIKLVEDIAKLSKYGIRAATDLPQDGIEPPEMVQIAGTANTESFELPVMIYLHLLGWYLAEGWTDKKANGTPTRACIAQAKTSPYYFILENVLKRSKLPYTCSKDGFRINDSRIAAHFAKFGLAGDKYIPAWVKELPPEYLWEFLVAYHGGDGDKKASAWTFYTTSPHLRDDLTEIAIRLGARTRVGVTQPKKKEHNIKYRVTFSYYGKHRYAKKRAWSKAQYSGKVWCPSVPNGIVCVRKNNTYYFGGNTELTIPPTLYGRALRWVETYAGYTGQSLLLEQLYETGFKNGEPHPDFLDLQGQDGPVVRVNRAAGMFVYWDTEPRMLWQTDKYYAEQAQTMPASEFQRIHRNLWVSPIESFVDEAWWEACEDSSLPALRDNDKTPVVVAIDMAVSRDCAALVAVTRDPFNPESKVAIRGVRIFSPKALGGIINQERDIRPVIEDWSRRWNVVCWAYDPHEMAKLAQDMVREGFGWFKPFSQQTQRAVADKELHDAIVSRQVSWNRDTTEGEIGVKHQQSECLFKHIAQAGADTSSDRYRIKKLADSAKIDGAVALSMARHVAMQLAIGNREGNLDNLIELLRKREITTDEFSKRVQEQFPRLKERRNNAG